MRITDSIRKAIQKAVEVRGYGGQTHLAASAGLDSSHISRYLSGEIKEIKSDNWDKLRPFLSFEDIESLDEPAILQHKSHYTLPLLKIFEQLSNDNQRAVLKYLDDVLLEQNRDRSIQFTDEELNQLAGKGISCQYGSDFRITTTGLCWLFNAIECSNLVGKVLSNDLFKKLLTVKLESKRCRDLRVRLFKVEVYSGHVYEQLTFYLNGSPPKFYVPYFNINGLTNIYMLEHNSDAPFTLADESVIYIEFQNDEVEELKAGKTLIIKPQVLATK